MGFTIEDMLVISRDQYKMRLVAGKNGWSNSIKWIFMFENTTILEHFTGKEMGVTTGLGFQTEEQLLNLVTIMAKKHASGLIVNTGFYLMSIPESVIEKCNEEDLPLLEVPWEVSVSEMIKDLTLRIFQQDRADEQISKALIRAIKQPDARDSYESDLLPYFDIDGTFQTILISNGHLDTMDTVDRRRLSYRLQIFLENITHNGNFFYYDSYFVLVVNNVTKKELDETIIQRFIRKVSRKLPEEDIYVSVGSYVQDISTLYRSFRRARSAMTMALSHKRNLVYFDDMGIDRLFYSTRDKQLIIEMGQDLLQPLIDYDEKKGTDYINTLRLFLEYNGSIQAVAKEMYTHRNTVIYHLNNIKKLLDSELDTPEERLPYLFACLIYTH